MAGANSNCHIVAVPYPGRGHVNPMLNLCRRILHSRPEIIVSFVLTEEWLTLLAASPPPNLTFTTIPNVLPSEIGRGKDFAAFFAATQTKMEAPVDQLLDRLQPPPTVIIYDTYLCWVVAVGNRRNIPVASFYTMSATVFSIFYHSDDFSPNSADEAIGNIHGVPPLRKRDLPTPLHSSGQEVLPQAIAAINASVKAQYLLFTSVYELESPVLHALKQTLHPIRIYSLGLILPHDHFNLNQHHHYLQWLDAQPPQSVLYISQGSFLSVSTAQLDQITAGFRASGVRFLWVARGDAEGVQQKCGGKGLVVPWCDQLKVLNHPSVGGFWSHCGWNSTKEGAFAGLPMLAFPIFWDQTTNSKMIVEDWKMGWKVKKDEVDGLVGEDDIAKLVLRFMDLKNEEGREMRRRAKEIQEIFKKSNSIGGSSHMDLLAFIDDIVS